MRFIDGCKYHLTLAHKFFSRFVALFSFLTTNISLLSSAASGKQFLISNLVILGCIAFLVNLINGFMRKREAKNSFMGWIPAIVPFTAALLIFLLS